jgi:hypothetical protein
MQDAFGVDRDLVSKGEKTKRAAIIGGSAAGGAVLGNAPLAALAAAQRGSVGYGEKGKHAVHSRSGALKGAAKGVGGAYNPMEWARTARVKGGKTGLALAAVPVLGGAAAGGSFAAHKTKVAKSDKTSTVMGIAGGGAGAGAGAGVVAAGRKTWNADHLPTKAQTPLESKIWAGHQLHEGGTPSMKDIRTPGEKAAGKVFNPKLGRIGRWGKGKTAAAVAAPAVLLAGAGAVAGRGRNKDAKVHL